MSQYVATLSFWAARAKRQANRGQVVDSGWWVVDGAEGPFLFTIHHSPSTIHRLGCFACGACARRVDAAGALTQEGDEFRDGRNRPELLLQALQRCRQRQPFAEQDAERLADGVDLPVVHAGAAQADQVDADNGVDVLLDDEWRDVLAGRRTTAEQRQPPDAHELMHGAVAREVDVVFQDAVAADEGAVRQNAAVADDAVVSDVAARHEEVVAADACHPGMGRAAVDRDVLAENVVFADLQAGRLAIVAEVLRSFAEDGAGVDEVAATHRQRAAQMDAGTQHAVGTDADAALNDDIRTYLDILGDLRFRCDDRRGVDASRRRMGHKRTRCQKDDERPRLAPQAATRTQALSHPGGSCIHSGGGEMPEQFPALVFIQPKKATPCASLSYPAWLPLSSLSRSSPKASA